MFNACGASKRHVGRSTSPSRRTKNVWNLQSCDQCASSLLDDVVDARDRGVLRGEGSRDGGVAELDHLRPVGLFQFLEKLLKLSLQGKETSLIRFKTRAPNSRLSSLSSEYLTWTAQKHHCQISKHVISNNSRYFRITPMETYPSNQPLTRKVEWLPCCYQVTQQ